MRPGKKLIKRKPKGGASPQDFYFRHLLNVPPPPNASGTYGTIIHEIIQLIHEGMKRVLREGILSDIASQLLGENAVLYKEKIEHQDVLKDQMINQQVVHLRLLKAEGRGSSRQFQFVYPEKEIIITPFFTNVMTEFFLRS